MAHRADRQHRITMPFSSLSRRFRQPSRSTKTRSPTSGVHSPAGPNHSACQNQPNRLARRLRVTNCCVSLQAQYQAFVRFTVESSTALSYCAQFDLLLEPFTPAGSRFRELWPHPHRLTGPATLDRCCGRNVVAPGEYSKGFFCVPIGLYQAILWPATALGMPARSALGAAAGVNPAAIIKPRLSPLWPCPASTTRAAARRQKAGRLRNQRAIGVQPVGAAIERAQRIVIPDLRGETGDVGRADIGRVRNDQIERARLAPLA